MAPAARCQALLKSVAVPAAARIVVYPGALHAFDVPELPARVRYGFATLGYHAGAAASARNEVEQFLRAGDPRPVPGTRRDRQW